MRRRARHGPSRKTGKGHASKREMELHKNSGVCNITSEDDRDACRRLSVIAQCYYAICRTSAHRPDTCETSWSPCSLKTDTPKHSPTSCQLLSEPNRALYTACRPRYSVNKCAQHMARRLPDLPTVRRTARRLPDLPTLRRSFRSSRGRKVSAVQTSMLPMHPASALQETADAFQCGQLHIA